MRCKNTTPDRVPKNRRIYRYGVFRYVCGYGHDRLIRTYVRRQDADRRVREENAKCMEKAWPKRVYPVLWYTQLCLFDADELLKQSSDPTPPRPASSAATKNTEPVAAEQPAP